MMRGWKTWCAAMGSVIYGVLGYWSELHDLDTAIKMILGGLALVGLGHKIDRIGGRELPR